MHTHDHHDGEAAGLATWTTALIAFLIIVALVVGLFIWSAAARPVAPSPAPAPSPPVEQPAPQQPAPDIDIQPDIDVQPPAPQQPAPQPEPGTFIGGY